MRIRTVKPEFWISEQMSNVSEGAALLAIGLLNYADDEGYFNANPELIRCALYPLRKPSKPIPQMLKELHDIGYIELGIANGGKKIGRVAKFNLHQVISRPKHSKLKEFFTVLEESMISHGLIHDASMIDPPLNGTGNGMEQGTGNARAALSGFDDFWKSYPSKVGKEAALKAWKKIKPDAALIEAMLDAIHDQKKGAKWLKDNGQYIPNPATWLNQGRWDDEAVEPMDPTGGDWDVDPDDPRFEGIFEP